eukprot:TRINITY_DN30858_c0_g1_i1.p1 TRINITY_DN30858_c0_g1~~TRINITY_DN30858_c0_g1_i1.p1  ORF type:complete len:179 (-),score=18.91 TRINITY_DN30858_c0_g1_i1:172-708(-)
MMQATLTLGILALLISNAIAINNHPSSDTSAKITHPSFGRFLEVATSGSAAESAQSTGSFQNPFVVALLGIAYILGGCFTSVWVTNYLGMDPQCPRQEFSDATGGLQTCMVACEICSCCCRAVSTCSTWAIICARVVAVVAFIVWPLALVFMVAMKCWQRKTNDSSPVEQGLLQHQQS